MKKKSGPITGCLNDRDWRDRFISVDRRITHLESHGRPLGRGATQAHEEDQGDGLKKSISIIYVVWLMPVRYLEIAPEANHLSNLSYFEISSGKWNLEHDFSFVVVPK